MDFEENLWISNQLGIGSGPYNCVVYRLLQSGFLAIGSYANIYSGCNQPGKFNSNSRTGCDGGKSYTHRGYAIGYHYSNQTGDDKNSGCGKDCIAHPNQHTYTRQGNPFFP